MGWEGLSEIGREFLFLPELGGGRGALPSPKYLQRYSKLASWVRPSKTVFIFVREHDKFCDLKTYSNLHLD